MKFTVRDCDPNTGVPDDDGYDDEYVVSPAHFYIQPADLSSEPDFIATLAIATLPQTSTAFFCVQAMRLLLK